MAEEATIKAQRQRSPNYPSIDLGEAVAKATIFQKAAGKTRVPFEAATSYLGYGSKSSSGLRCVAALTAFGLLSTEGQGKDRRLSLSEIGRRAVLSLEDSEERASALADAALMPKLHASLWERWGAGLPDDKTISSYLRMEHGFNENATASFIAEYRSTLNFAKLLNGATVAPDRDVIETPRGPQLESAGRPRMEATMIQPKSHKIALSVPLTRGGTFVFEASSALTGRDVDKIKRLLEAIQDDLEEDEPPQPEVY